MHVHNSRPTAAAGRGLGGQDSAPALRAPWAQLGTAGPGRMLAECACQGGPLTLAIEMVCCSMASWIATRSSSRICVGDRNVHERRAREWQSSGRRKDSSNHSQVATPCQANGRNRVTANPGDNYVGLALLSPLSTCETGWERLSYSPWLPNSDSQGLNTRLQVRGGFCCPSARAPRPLGATT